MHTSAFDFGNKFFEIYCSEIENATVVDIGAQNVNGSLRDICPDHLRYIGVDFIAGKGVDIILDDPYKLPFENESLDVVVCSSCFEHSQFFWILFVEILRVLKPTGLLYLNAPSNGSFHRYPVDCWRFYPDSGHALVEWARREGGKPALLESFIGDRSAELVTDGGGWNDFVAVFVKDEKYRNRIEDRMISSLSSFTNGYCDTCDKDLNPNFLSPDHQTVIQQKVKYDKQISGLHQALTERDDQISKLNETLTERDRQINFQNEKMQKLLQSHSWRFTKPLRLISNPISASIRPMRAAFNRSASRIPLMRQHKIHRIRSSPLFDQTFYAEQNPDVSAARIDPATHYSLSGWKEHRDPSAKFSTRHYLEIHPDVAAAGINPLLHYIEHGKAEGRQIHGAEGNSRVPPEDDDNITSGNVEQHSITMHQRIIELSALLHAIPRAVAFYQGSQTMAVQRTLRVWRREGIGGIRRRVDILLGGLKSNSGPHHSAIDLYGDLPATTPEFNPKVSIIVPNYNHAPYLRQRLESIYQQTYENIEVILLDDHSSDASVEILREFARRFPNRTVCKFNDSNSGSVFRQWKNGLEVATGELIWIAESDDFCSENFLTEQIRAFQNSAVMFSFCKTEFVTGNPPVKVWTLDDYLSDLGIADWEQPFVRSAHRLVCDGWAIKNIVPNVSSALFRHPRNHSLMNDPQWLGLRMCGDWVFYLSIIRGGLVAYTPAATNYYRQHDRSTSQTTQKKDLYYMEHEVVASYLVEFFNLDRSILDKQDTALYHHWCYHRGGSLRSEFRLLYDPNRAWIKSSYRRPNVVMAVYALISGGGETFPVILANLLYERGFAITLLNCLERTTEPGVLKMLDPRIPRLELPKLKLAGAIIADMGIEVVHSHHAWVDLTLASLLIGKSDIKQVITLHGMYEMMTPNQLDALMPLLSLRINHFVYTAEKNLAAFPESFRKSKRFSRISNALPSTSVNPVDRTTLAISQDDFVLCMVARGIPEKGWEEAIQAVNWANAHSARKIHLLLIGDGSEFDRLSGVKYSKHLHFLGFRQNIRDYFATCDMGFLPSRFKGESAPLVVIDCLLAGKPVLASDIGEIRHMLDSPDGLAGELFSLRDWTLDIEAIGRAIVDLANQPARYQTLYSRVASAACKFSTVAMVDSYEEVYRANFPSHDGTTNDQYEQA